MAGTKYNLVRYIWLISKPQHLNTAQVALCIHRYLVSGADESSLYLEVNSVEGNDVKCTAQNDAVLDGLLTVTHHSANEEDMMSMQADLPLLCEHDVHAIRDITSQFEVDFVSLTFTRDGEDVDTMRDFLDKMGLEQTKILAKVCLLQTEGNLSVQSCRVHFCHPNLHLCSWPRATTRGVRILNFCP